MWFNRKKIKEDLEKSYDECRYTTIILDEEDRERAYWKAHNAAVLSAVLPELKELKKNTWDKERIDRIEKILLQGLA